MKFRTKTIIGIAVIETLLLFILIVSSLSLLRQSNEEQLEKRALSTLKLFSTAIKDATIAADVAMLGDISEELAANPGVQYVRVFGPGNSLWAAAGNKELLTSPFVEDHGIVSVSDGIFDVTTTIGEESNVFGRIEIGFDADFIAKTLSGARDKALLIAIGELAFSALFSLILGSYLTRGLSRLEAVSKRLAQGERGIQVEVQGNDELASVMRSFNHMSSELQASYTALENRVEQRTQALARSEAHTRAILENIGEGIVTVDTSGSIKSINRAGARILGVEAQEVLGTHIDRYISKSLIDDSAYTLIGAMDDDNFGVQGHRADGTPFPMDLCAAQVETDEGTISIVIFRDITRRIEALNRLEQAQRSLLEAAHKAGMAEMSTGVLHNIGNILNSAALSGGSIEEMAKGIRIGGLHKANELLLSNLDNIAHFLNHDDKGRMLPQYFNKLARSIESDLKQIAEESEKLSQHLTMMKDVIKTQQEYARAGGFSEDLPIHELVADAIKVEQASLHKRGVRLEAHCPPDIVCKVNKSKVLQILTNLIKNAKEAVTDNDERNTPKLIRVESGVDDKQAAFIRVTDNGSGIEPEVLERIFEHGFTTKETGNGFGLHISINAAREMGGQISATSLGKNRGATFTLTLPLIANQQNRIA